MMEAWCGGFSGERFPYFAGLRREPNELRAFLERVIGRSGSGIVNAVDLDDSKAV